MGFPSPAQDYVEDRLSIDTLAQLHRPSVYLMRHSVASWREGIKSGALLVVDMGAKPCDGSLVVCVIAGQFRLKRLRLFPRPHLQHLDRLNEVIQLDDQTDPPEIRGVITHIVNDARTGEFDDCPVM